MSIPFPIPKPERYRQKSKRKNSRPKIPFSWWLFSMLVILFPIIFMAVKREFSEVTETDQDGKLILAPHRKEKYQQDSARLEDCEQYLLVASRNSYYPCYSCVDTTAVFLYKNEIFKVGMHCKGKQARYSKTQLKAINLIYIPQIQGDIKICKQAELRKIYNYPLLPENTKRKKPLGHPPGNRIDG